MTIDSLIDRIAHEMTADEPPAGLPDRVVAAISARPRPRRLWMLAPLGAAAALIVAAILGPRWLAHSTGLPSPGTQVPAGSAEAASSGALASSSVGQPAVSTAPMLTMAGAARTARARRPQVQLSAVEVAWLSRALPALAPPESPTVALIQPEGLSLPLMSVEPLATEPLVLPPLDRQAGERR